MRTLFLIIAWIIACNMAAFSQSSHPVQWDTSMKFKIDKPGIFPFINPLNKGKLEVPFNTQTPLFNVSKGKEMKKGRPAEDHFMVQGGMPILKPKGSFPMPVYQPDSTIRFTLQIKEYKRLP
ncbi:MAG: hypothetical protein ACM3O8_05780 [Methylococcaceae bacterium]